MRDRPDGVGLADFRLNPAASPSSANSSIVMVVALWLARDPQVLAAEGHADQPGEFGGMFAGRDVEVCGGSP
ncbi:MAG: hypothetical protein M3Y73_01440 [Actinomycetota bacterium]|nr:hypothetical protein [Actinomycetota bacterium]